MTTSLLDIKDNLDTIRERCKKNSAAADDLLRRLEAAKAVKPSDRDAHTMLRNVLENTVKHFARDCKRLWACHLEPAGISLRWGANVPFMLFKDGLVSFCNVEKLRMCNAEVQNDFLKIQKALSVAYTDFWKNPSVAHELGLAETLKKRDQELTETKDALAVYRQDYLAEKDKVAALESQVSNLEMTKVVQLESELREANYKYENEKTRVTYFRGAHSTAVGLHQSVKKELEELQRTVAEGGLVLTASTADVDLVEHSTQLKRQNAHLENTVRVATWVALAASALGVAGFTELALVFCPAWLVTAEYLRRREG